MAIDIDFSGPAQLSVDLAGQGDLEVDLLPLHRIGQHSDFDDSVTTVDYVITRKADGTFDMQAGSGGGGAVASVFGRTGAVVAVQDDYAGSQILDDSTVGGGSVTVTQALDQLQTLVNNAQSQSANLDDLAGLGVVSVDEISVGTGTGVYAYQSGSTFRDTIGLGTADNVEHAGITCTLLDSTGDITAKNFNDIRINTTGDSASIIIRGQSFLSGSQTITIPNTTTASMDFVLNNLAQTLTNKTLTTPTIASMTNAQHDHADAAGGGTVAHTALTAIGTNTHAQIDTHITALAAHLVWPLLAMTRYSDTTAIPNGSYTDVRWATNSLELNDYPFTLSGGGTANDEDTITLPEAGVYEIHSAVGWVNATGNGDITLLCLMAGSGGTMYGSPTVLEEGQSNRSCMASSTWTVKTTGALTTIKFQIKYTNNNNALAASIGSLLIKRIA